MSLEPGGQLELSGSPWRTAREAHAENLAAWPRRAPPPARWGCRWWRWATAGGPGARHALDAQVALPGDAPHAGERGALALNMMLMTSTGQVSLDWESEEDCVRKTVTTARLTPLLVALYANSPLVEGRDTGLVSFRSKVWTEVDPARCGYLRSWFDGSFSYRAYVDWALDAPLLPAPPRRVPPPQAHLPPAAAAGFEASRGHGGLDGPPLHAVPRGAAQEGDGGARGGLRGRGADGRRCGAGCSTSPPRSPRRALLPSQLRGAPGFTPPPRTQGRGYLRGQPLFRLAGGWWASRSGGWSGWMRRMRPCSRRSPRWRAAAARRPRRCARRGRRIRAPSRSARFAL